MASNNETVAEIGELMRKVDPTAFVVWWNQVAAAHNREIAAKDDERLTIVAIYENVIADKDREIAELREHIKIAEDALERIDNMCDGDMCKFFDNTHHCSACKYLECCQTGVAHAALHEIREKGANNDK